MPSRASTSTSTPRWLTHTRGEDSPDWSGADMVRALKKLGFVNERQVGSHVRMVKGTWRATVPMHTPHANPPGRCQHGNRR